MTPTLDNADPVELGKRLRNARMAAGLSQADAGRLIEAVRTTMIAIEKGQRRIKATELVRLADAYGVACNDLLRSSPVTADLVPQFRVTLSGHELQEAAMQAAQLLQRLASAYVEVEVLLNLRLRSREFEALAADSGERIDDLAEDYAARLRTVSGLGMNPVQDMVQLLEDWGFRVFVRPLDSRVSGVYAYDREMGPCVLLNRSHPRPRGNSTAAHEFGHDRVDRSAPAVVWEHDRPLRSRGERLAWAVGQAFLMPRPAVRKACADLEGPLTAGKLVYLAYHFRVSVEAMARRLEGLGLVKQGAAARVTERGIRVPPDLAPALWNEYPAVPARLAYLLSICEARGLLSEGQMSRMFAVDRATLRDLLDRFSGAGPE